MFYSDENSQNEINNFIGLVLFSGFVFKIHLVDKETFGVGIDWKCESGDNDDKYTVKARYNSLKEEMLN